MKYKVKDYAEVLYCISQIKVESEREVAVKDFLNILKKHYIESWLPNIFQNFENIYNKDVGYSKVEIISAYKLDNNHLKEIKKLIYKNLNNENIDIKEIIDKNVLGGFIAEAEHLRIKASLKDRLNALQF